MSQPRIAIVGTFDVANFGDLLFPLVAEHELRRRLGDLELVRYSYHERSAASWPYDVGTLANLGRDVGGLDMLIVGGGHLIRFEKAVAPGYGPPNTRLHHPTGYWLMPTLLAAGAGVPVVWNAVSASSDLPGWASGLLEGALAATTYAAVRDEPSLTELMRFSRGRRIERLPDTVFGIRELISGTPSEALQDCRRRHELPTRYVVVQPSPHLVLDASRIDRALGEVALAGVGILELPISPCLGDENGLLGLSTPTIRLSSWPRPLLLAELVANAEAVVARSLHLSIVALASGVPVYRQRSAPDPKYRALDDFESVRWWSDEDVADELLRGLGRTEVEAAVIRHSRRLEDHWDAIAGLVGSGHSDGQRVIADLWGDVTATLEEHAEHM